MEELTLLKIKTYDGNIEIPFVNLELLDEFTIRYKNKEELVCGLFNMLNISIDKNRVLDVYVYYEYMKNEQMRTKNSRVKYSGDNVDKKYLSEYLKELLKRDHDLIHYCGVRKIRSKGIIEFIHGDRDIKDFEIDYAVSEYLKGVPYGVFRKVYFFLKEHGVKFRVNKVVKDGENINRNLSKFHSDDSYIQSLLRRASDDGECDEIMDELSKVDLEDLRGLLVNSNFGLFDGVDNDRRYTLEDLYDLEKCSGISIDELSIYANDIKKVNRR